MELRELKSKIESNENPDQLLIFICKDNKFTAWQYVKAIAKIRAEGIMDLEDLQPRVTKSLFDAPQASSLQVYQCSNFDSLDTRLLERKNLIIMTDGVESFEVKALFASNVVDFPALEDWQLKDYAYSLADGADPKDIDRLVDLCGGDIYRLHNELMKINIFPQIQRKYVLPDFVKDGVFSDLSTYNIFTVSNAVQSRDIETLRRILPERDYMDVEPLGLLTILYNNFRKMIQVWLSSNPTPENTGLKSNQIWAIKKLPRCYSKEQLINIFEMLSDMDRRLKTGEIAESQMVDYMLLKILAV